MRYFTNPKEFHELTTPIEVRLMYRIGYRDDSAVVYAKAKARLTKAQIHILSGQLEDPKEKRVQLGSAHTKKFNRKTGLRIPHYYMNKGWELAPGEKERINKENPIAN